MWAEGLAYLLLAPWALHTRSVSMIRRHSHDQKHEKKTKNQYRRVDLTIKNTMWGMVHSHVLTRGITRVHWGAATGVAGGIQYPRWGVLFSGIWVK